MVDSPDALPLAAEFPPTSQAQWRKLVDGVLKGASFEQRLVSRSADGLAIEPLYARAPTGASIAGRAPGARWQVMQRIDHPDPDACNSEALHELDNGADGLALMIEGAIGAHGYGLPATPQAIERTLAGIHLDAGIAIELEPGPQGLDLPAALAAQVVRHGLSPSRVAIRFGLDPLGMLALHGRLPAPWRELAVQTAGTVADLHRHGFRGPFAAADGRPVHNAGGTEAQELAFALAAAVAYLRVFEAGGIALDTARRAVAFRLTADADQLLTIAKFRSLRRLWARIEASCGLAPAPASVSAETAWRTMTRDDPYVNILRATIAVFAAGAGGADAIAVLPFTAARGLPDRHARRLARNTQLVLLDEANIAHVADPTAGAGFSEDLSDKLCRAAWSAFQEIEAVGGLVAALERGLVQRTVAAARVERERALAEKEQMLVGANEYPSVSEVPVLDVPKASLPDMPAAMTAEPLAPVRLAAPFEAA